MIVGLICCSVRTASTLSAIAREHDNAHNTRLAQQADCTGASGRSSSASNNAPIGRPSTATKTTSADRHAARRAARAVHGGASRCANIISSAPATMRLPSTVPLRPVPMDSLTSLGIFNGRGRSVAARTMAAASTWWEACSSDAPSESTSSACTPGATSTESSRVPPTVSVPVLSNRTVRARAIASSARPPLTRIPRRAGWATPAMKATGAARISGHGVAARRTARLRMRSPEINHAMLAMTTVIGRKANA
jgi:hypothetical protein